MPDPIFADPRLARVYDHLEPDRDDLDLYTALVDELDARSVLDVGCGTGTFACRLASSGLEVIAVDPAAASLAVARNKAGADGITWLLGDATTLPALDVDLATMTGNVGQVFLTDEDLVMALGGIRDALRPGGHLAFEVRDPACEAWRSWNREESHSRAVIAGVGPVERWVELTDVDGQLVSFRWTYVFERSQEIITSDSTLRFRERHEIEASLVEAGFRPLDVRDAPDRPGREFVFVAERTG